MTKRLVVEAKPRMRDHANPYPHPLFSLTPPPSVHYQGTMHEELYTVLRLADLSMLETAESKPGGAPIDPGELKRYTYIHILP